MNKRQFNKRGFTLIEALVALLIIGIALPALISQVNSQINLINAKRNQGIAYWVAENQLTRLNLNYRLNQQFFRGKDEGETEMSDRTWYWTINVEDTPAEGMYRQTVTVRLDEDEPENVLVTLVGFAAEFNEIEFEESSDNNNEP